MRRIRVGELGDACSFKRVAFLELNPVAVCFEPREEFVLYGFEWRRSRNSNVTVYAMVSVFGESSGEDGDVIFSGGNVT